MSEVKVEINTKDFEFELAAFINENCMGIAKQVAKDARASAGAKTGNLKKHIRAKKSKFDDGGAIVIANAPHAHLVEYGTKGRRFPKDKKLLKFEIDGETIFARSVKKMPAKKFLRTALNNNIEFARQQFGAK